MVSSRKTTQARLPVQQLSILALCRFSEPLVLTSVYPYIPEMIESFGIEKSQIAKWAGLTSAVFSLCQSMTALIWGRASDSFGRKPAIITGLISTMTCSLIWGCSTNLAMAITARGLQGAFNGNVGTIRTMVAEMVPEKELQPVAFTIMPLVWSIGSIFGPSFGGFFAKPAVHFPQIFGKNAFFIKFPFALPNLIASAFFAVSISIAILYLKETNRRHQNRKDYGLILGKKISSFLHNISHFRSPHRTVSSKSTYACESTPLLTSSPSFTEGKKASLSEVLNRQSTLNLISYTFISMQNVSYDQILPIFMHNPRLPPPNPLPFLPLKFSGGFGIDSSRIGTLFTIYGIFGCLIQFFVFPSTARRFGVLNCYKWCAIIFPIIHLVTPYTALIESVAWQQGIMLIIMFVKCIAVIFVYPCSVIIMTNSANSLSSLATLNGFAVCFSSLGRAIGPALVGIVFTWGMKHEYGVAPWWLLTLISIIGVTPIWWLVEGDGIPEDTGGNLNDNFNCEVDNEESPLLRRLSCASTGMEATAESISVNTATLK
ncbi:unnamed protein product [Blumeria hordei]|uniref:Major facilitator superfamily (MFS) profile domain-containing protein n=1 Tax=Blumeria hordei TaxID=2867405 RepID=A0A383V027_BLUHO|nr:unnamed protein product [Blumeria hordei]